MIWVYGAAIMLVLADAVAIVALSRTLQRSGARMDSALSWTLVRELPLATWGAACPFVFGLLM